jgi:hypothetical protein
MPLALSSSNTDEPARGTTRPVKSYRHGGVQPDVWKNSIQSGDIYNTTIKNSYKDETSGEWKETGSYSAMTSR